MTVRQVQEIRRLANISVALVEKGVGFDVGVFTLAICIVNAYGGLIPFLQLSANSGTRRNGALNGAGIDWICGINYWRGICDGKTFVVLRAEDANKLKLGMIMNIGEIKCVRVTLARTIKPAGIAEESTITLDDVETASLQRHARNAGNFFQLKISTGKPELSHHERRRLL